MIDPAYDIDRVPDDLRVAWWEYINSPATSSDAAMTVDEWLRYRRSLEQENRKF